MIVALVCMCLMMSNNILTLIVFIISVIDVYVLLCMNVWCNILVWVCIGCIDIVLFGNDSV